MRAKYVMQNRPHFTYDIFLTQVSLKTTHPYSMEEEWEAFFGQGFPLAETVHYVPGGFKTQFILIEELGGQREQGLVRTVVVDQLSHLL